MEKIPPLASKQLEPLLTPISDIHPHPDNYKIHTPAQIKDLRASLKAFGCTSPIKVNLQGVIVAGHGMYQLYLEDGYTHVPVMFEALDKQLSKAYLVADNETARKAETDQDKLNSILEFASEIPDFDIEAVGFSTEDLDSFLQSGEPTEVVEDDFNPGDEVETRCKEGDLWQLGKHRLLCGDSTKREDVERLLDGNVPELMVTDPPYGVEYDPSWRNKTNLTNGIKRPTRAEGKVMNDDIVDWSPTYNLFPGNIAYVWHAGKYSNEVQQSLESSGFEVVSQIIWAKPHFILSRGDYHWKHEPCWYVVRKGKNHSWGGARDQTTVWDIAGMNCFGGSTDAADETTGHGTQKPIECMARPIRNHDISTVYEPFAGSGTTLIACEQLGKKCFAIEISEKYVNMIIARWEKFTGQTAIKLTKRA